MAIHMESQGDYQMFVPVNTETGERGEPIKRPLPNRIPRRINYAFDVIDFGWDPANRRPYATRTVSNPVGFFRDWTGGAGYLSGLPWILVPFLGGVYRAFEEADERSTAREDVLWGKLEKIYADSLGKVLEKGAGGSDGSDQEGVLKDIEDYMRKETAERFKGEFKGAVRAYSMMDTNGWKKNRDRYSRMVPGPDQEALRFLMDMEDDFKNPKLRKSISPDSAYREWYNEYRLT